MRTQPRCKLCGEPITFVPRPGIYGADERVKYVPVNLDDLRPHWRRCKLNQELAEAKRLSSGKSFQSSSDAAPKGKRSLTEGQKSEPQQGEMFKC